MSELFPAFDLRRQPVDRRRWDDFGFTAWGLDGPGITLLGHGHTRAPGCIGGNRDRVIPTGPCGLVNGELPDLRESPLGHSPEGHFPTERQIRASPSNVKPATLLAKGGFTIR